MRKIKIIIVKLASTLLKLIGKGGSFPGTIWLKLDPTVLNYIEYPKTIILVTGTNGKTSTTNLIYQMMKQVEPSTICNDKGDNMLIGIATLILNNITIGLKIKSKAMVLEVDELNVPKVMKYLSVTHIVVLNFFRDQLDRSGEMENIINKFENCFKDYKGQLILNAYDPNVIRLAKSAPEAKITSFAIQDKQQNRTNINEAKEGRFCPICNADLNYEYYQYAHIGKFSCPNCGFAKEQPNIIVYKNNDNIIYNNIEYKVFNTSMYAIYNYTALIALATILNIDINIIKDIILNFSINKGRNESFKHNNHEVILNLVKNPTGANEVLKEIAKDNRPKHIVFILNDYPNDGEDISWIYDAKFEYILNDNTLDFTCSGTRAYDLALRLSYANFTSININLDYKQAIEALNDKDEVVYVCSTYSNLVKVRTYLKRNEL
ncbi:MAG: MurT ligase domain-containing protein [Erysipelotrichaceae bacterium]